MMLEIFGPVPKSLTACDIILKLGSNKVLSKYEERAEMAIEIAPTIPKYPPLIRVIFKMWIFFKLRTKVPI